MSLAEALERLFEARQYVIQGEQCMSRQRKIVEMLDQQGYDPLDAIAFLEQLEDLQEEYVSHQGRIEKQVMTIIKPE